MIKLMITKAALLILVWTLCSMTALMWSNGRLLYSLYMYEGPGDKHNLTTLLLVMLPSMVLLFAALPFFGWLADSRLGNFKVFRAGGVLLSVGSVLVSVSILVVKNINKQVSVVTSEVLGPFAHLVSFSGGSACWVTLFQLGLDQMPDSSSAGITTYITSYCTVFFLGVWISNSLFAVLTMCVPFDLAAQSLSLLPVVCMCVVLSLMFFVGEKWLIIEPQSPQSLKTIYRVLKFAVKHKAPLNRSALTYWEENIPTRLDLGKSRYGGPFTTEQVESVKTLGGLLLVFLPVWISIFSTTMFGGLELGVFDTLVHHNQSAQCVDSAYTQVTVDPLWCIFFTLFVYTVCVHPCLKNRLHRLSILKRIGCCLFMFSLNSISYAFVRYYFSFSIWPRIVHTWLSTSLLSLSLISSTEFLCAQSPYSMRGFLSGINFFMISLSSLLGVALFNKFLASCFEKHCLIIPYSIGAGLGIAGFLFFLVTAHRYKLRVREEEYHPYPHIEDIYTRRILQEQSSRSHLRTFPRYT